MPLRTPAPRPQPPEPVVLGSIAPSRSAGSDGVKLRRLHDVEVMLQEREERLVSCEARSTQQHLEIQRLRNQLDSRDKDVQYVHRLLERARSDASRMAADVRRMQAELDAHHAVIEGDETDRARTPPRSRRTPPGAGLSRSSSAGLLPSWRGASAAAGADGSGNSEHRCAWLETRVAQEAEASRSHQREVARLQREAAELREAVAARGEVAISAHELAISRGETMQLALSLHEQKENARRAREAAEGEARRAARAEEKVKELEARAGLAERAADEWEAEAKGKGEAVAKLDAQKGAMLDYVQEVVTELAAAEHRIRQLSEAKLSLTEALNHACHERAAAQAELARRTEEAEVEIGLLAERQHALARTAEAEAANARVALVRAEEALREADSCRRELQHCRSENSTLLASADELAAEAERNAQARDRAEAKALQQADELSKIGSHLAVIRESSDSQHGMLTDRLQVALRELHGTIHERDRLRAALDEALTSCAGAVVARQVAEAAKSDLQVQLADERHRANAGAAAAARDSRAPR